MLSISQSKYIRSLALQKFRKEHQAYLVEGEKIAQEYLADTRQRIIIIAALDSWLQQHPQYIAAHPSATVISVTDTELAQISQLHSPNKVLLVVQHSTPQAPPTPSSDWCLALDDIRDPGNMGTILRIADWFGIAQVLLSPQCVDAYSPKVVQAAMGAQLRVGIHTVAILDYLRSSPLPSYAAVLAGSNVYRISPAAPGIIIIGSEATGISAQVLAAASHRITIPQRGGAESLNAGVSAGILCALLLGG
ncbi:MAG: RNA methyltransferase [Chitinophagaceae bacterium]|nr:RNA methyltransferase [Chitinophagaceae bacterium]